MVWKTEDLHRIFADETTNDGRKQFDKVFAKVKMDFVRFVFVGKKVVRWLRRHRLRFRNKVEKERTHVRKNSNIFDFSLT